MSRTSALNGFVALLCGLLGLLAGCSDNDEDPVTSSQYVSGADLFGLVDNRQLIYLQTDTTVDANLNIDVTTLQDTVNISGSGENWVLKDGAVPVVNLKVTNGWVVQNGYWREVGGQYQITYFDPPPVLMPAEVKRSDPWTGTSPLFNLGAEYRHDVFYYAYFGFYYTREFNGIELLQLPGGSYNAYRVDVQLFWNVSDTAPAAEVTEWFVPSVGLVKQRFVGGPLKRTSSLISYQ